MRILFLAMLLLISGCVYENNYDGEDEMIGVKGTQNKQGWSASGTLIQGSMNEVSLQADFPIATNYTAQFKINGDLRRKNAVAEIKWAVEGNWVTRIISIADGASIQGAAQAISVKIRDNSPAPSVGVDPAYTVSVQVVPGTRASNPNPPILRGPSQIVFGASNVTIPVPGNSGVNAVAVLISTITNIPVPDQAVTVIQEDSIGAPLASYDPRQFLWVPLQPLTSNIVIQNTLVAPNSIRATVIWGIDG